MNRLIACLFLLVFLSACVSPDIQATETGLKEVATTAVASSTPVATDFVEISSTPEPTAIPAAEGETPIDPPPVLPPTEGVEFQLSNGMLEQFDEALGQYVPLLEADSVQVDGVTGYRVFLKDGVAVALTIGEQNVVLANEMGLFELGENMYFWQNEVGLHRFMALDNSTHWVYGRKPADEMVRYQLDQQTNLIAAVNAEGIPVAYFAPQVEGGKWLVNPLLETAYDYDFERLKTGQWVVNHFGVEYGYKPYELAGVEYVMPSELPASFWDEGVTWPEQGTLALKDSKGNIYMYYAPDMGKWMFAGTKLIPPGNTGITVLLGGSYIENTGVPYGLVSQARWPESETIDYWRKIRHYMDWNGVADTMGEAEFHFEDYVRKAEAGETFTYPVKAVEEATGKEVVVQITNKTPVILVGGLFVNNTFSRLEFPHQYENAHEFYGGIYLNQQGVLVISNYQMGSNFINLQTYFQAGRLPLMPISLDNNCLRVNKAKWYTFEKDKFGLVETKDFYMEWLGGQSTPQTSFAHNHYLIEPGFVE